MDKVIILIADTETEAFRASQKLNELNINGDISLGENIVVLKSDEGKATIKNAKGELFSYTLGGALTGTFLGILGGPLGMLIGASVGSLIGLTGDLISGDSKEDYLKKLIDSLPNGKAAFIAHVDESWEVPIDTVARELNIKVNRIDLDEAFEESFEKEIENLDHEIEDTEDKIENAVDKAKEKLEKMLFELKDKRDQLQEQWSDKIQKQRKQYEDWSGKLKEKIAAETDEIKEELKEKRFDFLKKRIRYQEERLEKLRKKL